MEQWAEVRRMALVEGLSRREISRRTGLHRNTVRDAIASSTPPKYERPARGSKLDPFKDEIHRLLAENDDDSRLTGVRIGELLAARGWDGGKTILDDYLREVRPLFEQRRTFQRTTYRPGEIVQFDVWEPCREVPVGHGQTRKGFVVVACLGYSRIGAGALVFSKQTPDLLAGIRSCLWQLGGLAQTMVWDRQAGLHCSGGRPTTELAGLLGELGMGWHFCAPKDPQAKGAIERLQGFMETSFEPGRVFANELDFQHQLEDWFAGRANGRLHRTLRCRPLDRLPAELEVMAPLTQAPPDTDRRWVLRVSPDPYVRFDTCDYSLDPGLVGRRVEIRISEREVRAVALDSGEIACQHARCFAKHVTITDPAHAKILTLRRTGREPELAVETRSLDVYDRLIA